MTTRTCVLLFAMSLTACGGVTSSNGDMATSGGDMASKDMAGQQGDMAMVPPKLVIPAGCTPTMAGETASSLITLVQSKCFGSGCHNMGVVPAMTTANELLALKGKASSSSFSYVTANDYDKSYILYKLTGAQQNVPGGNGSKMPLTGSLTDSEVCRFIRWVANGAN